MNSLLRVPPPVYAVALLMFCKGLEGVFPIPLDISVPCLGGGLLASGMGLILWTVGLFLGKGTTPLPAGKPSALVREGPYRLTRNPMYLGLLLILAGIVFLLGSPYYLLAPVGCFLVLDRLFVPHEEAKLQALFGADYDRLKARTRRWI